jgi:hypothetical protein
MRSLSLKLALAISMIPIASTSDASQPSRALKRLETIPAQFQGIWDADAKACEAAASDMRYYIRPNRMRFGDAVGTVRRVVRRGNQSVSVTTDFRSDGDPWEGDVRLTLSPAGNELTIQTGESRTSRYRCRVPN